MERPTVVIELADDPKLSRDLSAGGVFVPRCALELNADCTLVVRGPAEEIELAARVVYVDPKTGAGLELIGFTPALRDHLTKLMTTWSEPPPPPPLDLGFDPAVEDAPPAANDDGDKAEQAKPADLSEEEQADPVKRKHALNLHERLRGLTLAQQIKTASSSDPQERILLERFYNKNVWEALLRNPRLTPPEVARIARMGTLPRVMLEIIVNNGSWLQIPEVRRALLGNPRLGTDQVLRVLRMLPKHELKLASLQTAYPYSVRDAAKRLIKEH
ncbi:MAG: PilZ domain-containing protein [Myxococcota bacterium]|nr:PilZ domain-containing protein [Myxococcota bacterium]